MDCVFVLHHVHVFPNGEEDVKLIGVFRSRTSAEAAVAQLRSQPGFREFPKLLSDEGHDASGFTISSYNLDSIHWLEGFVTM